MKADAQTEAAVKSVMDKFADNYSKRDLEGVLALFAPDSDLVMYGTGADEKRVGLAEVKTQVERDWSQSDAVSLSYDWTSVSARDAVAWVASDVAFKARIGEDELTLAGRLTLVLENRDGRWLIAQGHFSVPPSAQAEGESFPT